MFFTTGELALSDAQRVAYRLTATTIQSVGTGEYSNAALAARTAKSRAWHEKHGNGRRGVSSSSQACRSAWRTNACSGSSPILQACWSAPGVRRTPCLALRRMLANVALRTSIGSRRRSVPLSSSRSKAYRNACGSFRRVAEQVECSHSSASQHTTSPSIRQQRTLRWFTASTIA